jgi:hypothetical protein
MADEPLNAVSNERIEAAVNRTLRLRARQTGVPLELLALAAVEETFGTIVTGHALDHRLAAIHAAIVVDVLQRAENCLGDQAQTEVREYSSPPCMLHELDATFMEHPERPPASAKCPNDTRD